MSQAASEHRIGLIPCLAFSIGTMVGGGVFTLSGVVLDDAGPSAIVSYLIAAAVMLLSALSFVAVATRAGPGDSGYGPVGDLLGPVWRFVTMWAFYLNGVTIIAFLVVSFGDYLNQDFAAAIGPTVAAVIAAGLLAALNLGPADLVGRAETFIVAVKVGILLMFVGWGLASITDARFTPFATGGAGGILGSAALLFTAYTGFNVVTNMAGALENPQRNVPLAVLLSIGFAALLYVGVALAMLASGVDRFGATGVGKAAEALMGGWGGPLIAFAACLSTLSGANANLLGTSELTLRLAAQGDVPPVVGRTTRRGHPYVSVLFVTVIAIVLVLTASTDTSVAAANVGALIGMIVMNVAAFRLARQGWPRGMRLPGGTLLPTIGIVTCLLQFPSLSPAGLILGLVAMLAGLALYTRRTDERLGAEAVAEARRAIGALETPLARVLRRGEASARRLLARHR